MPHSAAGRAEWTVMVGKTVHTLQLLGWMPATILQGADLPYWAGMWFGLFPTAEGFALQLASALLVIGSYVLAELQKRRQRVSSRLTEANIR